MVRPKPNCYIHPEEVAYLVVVDLGMLDCRFGQPEVRESLTETCDRCDHGDESKVGRGQHMSQHYGRNRLQNELRTLRSER